MAAEVTGSVPTDTATLVLRGSRHLRRRTRLFNACAFQALVWLLAAIVAKRPDLLGLAAPFVTAIVASFVMYRPPDLTANLRLGRDRLTEGDTTAVTVELSSESGLARVEVELALGDRLVGEGTTRAVTSIAPGKSSHVNFEVTAIEWGRASVETVSIRTADRFGLFGGLLEFETRGEINVGLPEDRGQFTLEAERFRSIVGSHLSNDRGQGLEIADIRPYQPGDSMKNINWRISNRRQEPWVTLRHPDRSTSLVLVVDAHEADHEEQRAMQRRSAAAALALARSHLAIHDQVGLLIVGHTLHWLPPKLGRNHLYRIADALISVSNTPEASLRLYRPPAVAHIPKEAIVVAFSPLLDPQMAGLVAELRSHGNPTSVLLPEVLDDPAPPRIRLRLPERHADESARLAKVERAIGIRSLRDRGVAIVPWPADEPVANVIRTLQRLRQSISRGRAA